MSTTPVPPADTLPSRIDAEVRQVKSMVDRTVNLTVNLPEYETAAAQWMLAHIGAMVRLTVAAYEEADDDR